MKAMSQVAGQQPKIGKDDGSKENTKVPTHQRRELVLMLLLLDKSQEEHVDQLTRSASLLHYYHISKNTHDTSLYV